MQYNLSLSLSFSFSVVGTCVDLSVRLSNQDTLNVVYMSGLEEVTSGILEICANESFLQVCKSSSFDSGLANTVCHDLGYGG